MTSTFALEPDASLAPLAGIRVVEFGQYIAVPAAGQLLRDLGAEVVKVESADGDPARHAGWQGDAFGPMFASYNRGKRSVALDLASETGRRAAFDLAVGADVVLQNARPGAMQRAGLAPAQLRAAAPRLIVATVSGFSPASPLADRAGLDIAAQAESGMMSLNGPGDGEPTRVGFAVVDAMTAQSVANAVLAALVRRGARGVGATIEVALLDVATCAMAWPWAEYGRTGRMPLRSGNGQPAAAPAADVVPTADGAVVISAYVDAHFSRLAEALGRPALAGDARFASNAARVANRAALLAELRSACAGTTTQALCAVLGKAGVVVAAVRRFDQVRTGDHGLSPDLFVRVTTPGGQSVEVPGLPFRIDGVDALPTDLPAQIGPDPAKGA